MPARREVEAQIVAAMVQGVTRAEVARRADISERSLRRRLREPGLITAIAAARADHHRQVLGQLNELAVRAVRELDALLGDEDAGTRLRAARLILEQSSRFRAAADDARMSAMEAAQAETQAHMERIGHG